MPSSSSIISPSSFFVDTIIWVCPFSRSGSRSGSGAAAATFRRRYSVRLPELSTLIAPPSLSVSLTPHQPELGCCSSLSLSTYFPAQRNFASESKAILVFSVNLIRLFNDSISLFDNLARSNCTSWVLPPLSIPYHTLVHPGRIGHRTKQRAPKANIPTSNSIRFIRTKTVPGLSGPPKTQLNRIESSTTATTVLSCPVL